MGIYDIWEVLNPKPYIYIYVHMYGLGSRVLTAAGLGTHQKGMSSCC